ncbi:MAG: hypothetical protein RLZZ371_1187 [Pseudomonadota bacterium]
MIPVLAIILPIYLAIALGFVTTRGGLFVRADMRVFGKFVMNLALPAMLFNALSQRQIGEILNGSYVLAYAAGALVMIGLGLSWGKYRGLGATDNVVTVMGMSCSNSGFVGYPILLLMTAPVAAVALTLNILVENLLVIPLLLALAERSRGEAGHWTAVIGQSLKRLAANPLIMGLAAGLLVSVMRWQLPEPLLRAINLFALSSAGLSLFVIGGTLVGLPLAGMWRQIMPIVFGKLVLHPLAVWGMVMMLPWLGLAALAPQLRQAAVLMAAVPMMSIYPILAQSYGREDMSAAALLATTVVSFVSLSGLIWLMA